MAEKQRELSVRDQHLFCWKWVSGNENTNWFSHQRRM